MVTRLAAAAKRLAARDWPLGAGLRAALACGVPLALAALCDAPGLSWAALIAFWVIPIDPGWPRWRQFVTITAFILASATGAFLAVLLRPHLLAASLFAGLWCFGAIFIRVWGEAAASAGSMAAVILLILLGVYQASSLSAAVQMAVLTLGGGLWGLGLVMLPGGKGPEAALRAAIARIFALEAVLAEDIRDGTSRLRRGAVREAIEAAREVIAAAPPPQPGMAAARQVALGAFVRADHLLLALLRLRTCLADAACGSAPCPALDGLPAHLHDQAAALAEGASPTRPSGQPPPLSTPPEIAAALADAWHWASPFAAAQLPPGPAANPAGNGALSRRIRLLRENLSWGSLSCRHAARFAVTGSGLTALTDLLGLPHRHWITLAAVIVLQTYPSATLQRALARVGGTIAGGAIAAAAAVMLEGPAGAMLVMVPLSLLAMVVRSASYALYVMCVTPLFLIMTELYADGGVFSSGLSIERLADNLTGAAIGLLATVLFWPSWESRALRPLLAQAVRANGAFLLAALASGQTAEPRITGPRLAALRRAAGLAGNNAEAALRRMQNEPRLSQPLAPAPAMVIAEAARGLAAIAIGSLMRARQAAGGAGAGSPACALVIDEIGERLRAIADGIAQGSTPNRPPPTRAAPAPPEILRARHLLALIEEAALVLDAPSAPPANALSGDRS